AIPIREPLLVPTAESTRTRIDSSRAPSASSARPLSSSPPASGPVSQSPLASHQESGVFVAKRAGIPGMTEEEDLIARAVTGDTTAFRALYTRHRSDVGRLVYRMIGAQSDLDDVVQEVFFQVFRSLKDFRGQSKFSTWLHRVTVNVVLMHRRAAR